MWIKEVVIDGFKSYAERTEIGEFDSQFNAITGLNGSGKSNILDSICFVLGISNLSQVRRCHLNVWVLVTLTSIPAVVAILYFSLQVCMHVYWGSGEDSAGEREKWAFDVADSPISPTRDWRLEPRRVSK